MTNLQKVTSDLNNAISMLSRESIADKFDIDLRTLKKWEEGHIRNPGLLDHALQALYRSDDFRSIPLVPNNNNFTFIDLFAGIGGTRLGFESIGGKCVFTCEIDKYCVKTYKENHVTDHSVVGDIRNVSESDVPDHDVLVAGFPCQPFSIAGVSKKNSLKKKHGFKCQTQGTLFFDIARIIAEKKPTAFMLENVKNLVSHDKGRTFNVIKETLSNELGYNIHFKVIDAQHFVPQHRERIFIVGFKDKVDNFWDELNVPEHDSPLTLGSILHPEDGSEVPEAEFTLGEDAHVNPKYTLSKKLWSYLKEYARKHREKGNGFGYGKFDQDGVARTLSARYYKDGSEILISRGTRKNPRRLTPRECARLMGFNDEFKIPVSDTQAYKQFGNSVVVPVVQSVARTMYPHIISSVQKNSKRKNQQFAIPV